MEKAITAKAAPNSNNLKVATVNQTLKQTLNNDEQLAFHRRLQMTLDIKQLIRLFTDKLKEQYRITSLEYHHQTQAVTIADDLPARHKSCYFLNLEGVDLGELTLTRNERFSDNELVLLEQSISLLPCYLKNALEHHRLMKMAFTDSLTGTMNRTALDNLLPKEIERAERHNNALSLLMIDLDHFKDCNDRVGHLGGDEVLRQVSNIIKQNIRFSDLIFRYGGEEFLVILPHADLSGAVLAGELIRKAVNNLTVNIGTTTLRPSVSIGAATHNKGEDKSFVVSQADSALYQAKIDGRNCTRSQQQITG